MPSRPRRPQRLIADMATDNRTWGEERVATRRRDFPLTRRGDANLDATERASRDAQSSMSPPGDKSREQDEGDTRDVVRGRSDPAFDVVGKLFPKEQVLDRELRAQSERQSQQAQDVSEQGKCRSDHVLDQIDPTNVACEMWPTLAGSNLAGTPPHDRFGLFSSHRSLTGTKTVRQGSSSGTDWVCRLRPASPNDAHQQRHQADQHDHTRQQPPSARVTGCTSRTCPAGCKGR